MIGLGCDGAPLLTDTEIVCAEPVPQLFVGVTEIVPPAAPTVAVIELVVELPDHPAGSDHA